MEKSLPRIYQIGFNKCGTLSLHRFFQANGLTSIHWDQGKLSKAIYQNAANQLPLFSGYEGIQCFTDMEHRDSTGCSHYAYADLFRTMHEQDPEGLFILNFRPVDQWVHSRKRHASGGYLRKEMSYFKKSEDEVFKIWASHYHHHLEQAKAFFSGRTNFLLFDISVHDGAYLARFLRSHGFKIDSEGFHNRHHTDTVIEWRNSRENINAWRKSKGMDSLETEQLKNFALWLPRKLRHALKRSS